MRDFVGPPRNAGGPPPDDAVGDNQIFEAPASTHEGSPGCRSRVPSFVAVSETTEQTHEPLLGEEAMPTPPNLLNDDGTASIATALLMSHHAFRRDLARFAAGLGRVAAGDRSTTAELAAEWQHYRGALHGHHEVEDKQMFPGMRGAHAELAPVFDELSAQHARIDPLLARGDATFVELGTRAAEASAIVAELSALLDQHLALEEAHVPAFLRAATGFPPPGSDAEADMYAQGFAWSSDGIAADVLERVYAILPSNVTSRLPAARAAFAERCARVWGPTPSGASRTSVPDRLAGR
jgi:hypothetical protein